MTDKMGVTWDLSSYFPEFDGLRMRAFKVELEQDIERLKHTSSKLTTFDAKTLEQWETLLLTGEDIYRRLGHLASYLGCLEAADARNEAVSLAQAALVRQTAAFEKFEIDVLGVFKRVPRRLFEVFCERPHLREIAYYLKRLRERARTTMSRREEALASDLNIDGLSAWGRLYDKVTGKLEFDFVAKSGQIERRPISQWRSLLSDPDREIGRAAFEGGNRAWRQIEDTCAAALNAIAGTRMSLNARRRVAHFMDRALFQAAIRRETLEAMYAAIFENIDTARDILRLKAGFFDRQGIWFFEREAPLPLPESAPLDWGASTATVARAFAAVYPDLGNHFRNMLERRWIESEARPGKRPGAFCTGSSVIEEQRVFMTFNGTLGDVTTLAHEVGHAWHGHLLRGMRPFARRYPMTLAETASIFSEHIFMDGLLQEPSLGESQRLHLLDTEMTDAAVFLLDITTRYTFEKAFYEERRAGEVPVSRLRDLMTDTQRAVYGDALLPDGTDPYFWASKLHFYITDTTFYNFPYTFGYLLARSLIDRYHSEGQEFIPQYEAFLQQSGGDTVENVGRRTLAVDFTDRTFWAGIILNLNVQLEEYRERITGQKAGISQGGNRK
ncbi:MAG: M3 family oligoendopeptidase [Desulfobacterales bacterium]